MSDTEKMNEAMYERLGEIVFKAANTRTICNGVSGADEKNLQLLAAFTDLRQMCEFYKPEEKVRVGSSSSRKDGSTPLSHSHSDLELPTGCPSLMSQQLPGGFDGVWPAEKEKVEELQKRGAKIKACNERSRARIFLIEKLAEECLRNTNHPNGYEPGQYGSDYRTFGKAFSEIRKLVRESIADVAPDYEMLALQFARNSFDFAKFQEALAAVASMKAEDFPGFYYKPGWLCELAKKLEASSTAPSSSTVPPPLSAAGADKRKPTMDFGRFHVTRSAIPGRTIITFRMKREHQENFATVVPGRIIVADIHRADVGSGQPVLKYIAKSYMAGEKPRVLFAGDSWTGMSKTEKMVYKMVKCNIKETQRRRIRRKRAAAAKAAAENGGQA